MKLDRIKLTNFRCYQELEVELHPQVTVLVAENGQGKTTLLDAVRIALCPYVNSFDLAKSGYSDPANTITVDDIRLAVAADSRMLRILPSKIEVDGHYNDHNESWSRFRDSDAKGSRIKDDKRTRALKDWGKLQQNLVRNPNELVDLPVFGYYGTGRLWKEKRLTANKKGKSKTKREKTDEQINTFAYRDCLDPASSYKQFEDWYSSAFIKMLESQIEKMQSGAANVKAEEYLQNPIEVIQNATNELLKETGWHNVAYSQQHDKSLVLRHKEKGVLKVDQLSDGIKNMLAMVADIAYRCSHLNSHLGKKAAKLSKGIVLIDEVDMHLHPKWQQTVIKGLTTAFPNLQFIVTTHSPQVLSTVAPECIRMITWEDQKPVIVTPDFSLGAEPQQLLEDIQGVTPRPQNIEIVNKLNRYLDMVNDDQWDSNEAQELRTELDNWAGEHDPVLVKADMDIRLRQRRRG